MAETVFVEDRGAVRRIVLNRPQKRNALDHRTIEAVLAHLEQAKRDDEVSAIVLAGEGSGFSAGADLQEARVRRDEMSIRHHAELMARLLLAPSQLRKPIVAEVHGFALGAGLGLALACDVAFCADDATLAFPETRHGMLPALVAPPLLRRVGAAAGFELLATPRPIPVSRAAALGLVRSTAPDAVRSDAEAFAAELAAVPYSILTALRNLLSHLAGQDLPSAIAIAREANIATKLGRVTESQP